MQEEFLNSMEEILGDDFQKYLDSLNKIPRKAVHLNTTLLKDKNILSSFLKEQIPFDSTSYFIDEEKPGLSIFHILGLYYVQEPSAMMPALAAKIKKDAKILDLCASPGGKTLQLSNLAPEGIIYANEINGNRLKNLVSNIERLGLKNVITTQMSSKDLKNVFQNYFDVILVDAPCSLEGTFRKNPLAISLWSKEKVREMALIQKALCKDAASMLKKNGMLIYSTCTFSKEEDEEVIKDADIILQVTPSKFTRNIVREYKKYIDVEKQPIIVCSKGIEKETSLTLDEVILEEIPNARIGALSRT